jgi:hypothetical protein
MVIACLFFAVPNNVKFSTRLITTLQFATRGLLALTMDRWSTM